MHGAFNLLFPGIIEMLDRHARFWVVVCLLLSCAGCGWSDDEASNSGSDSPLATEGRWYFVLSSPASSRSAPQDFYLALLEIEGEGEAASAGLLDRVGPNESLKLASSDVKDGVLHLDFKDGDGSLDFRGKATGKEIVGNTVLPDGRILCSRLVRTTDTDAGSRKPAVDTPGMKAINDELNAKSDFDDVAEFCRKHADSPLTLDIYSSLLLRAGVEDVDKSRVTSIVDEYVKTAERWGPRMVAFVRFRAGTSLCRSGKFVDLGVKNLKQGREELEEYGLAKANAGEYLAALELAEIAKAIETARSGDKAEGVKKLKSLRKSNPFNPMIRFTLAEAADEAGDVDAALEGFAGIAALPRLQEELVADPSWEEGAEKPGEAVARLLKKKDGSTSNVGDFLNESYEREMKQLADNATIEPVSDLGTQTTLVELFTGSQCPPCVAADVATDVLSKSYPEDHLIVLRWHQDIPGSDPMANGFGEERFRWYMVDLLGQTSFGTPTVFANGERLDGVGGFLTRSMQVFETIHEEITPALKKKSDLTIDATASMTGDEVSIDASVDGLPSKAGDLRLGVVLAEDAVSYEARNGVRLHETVARWAAKGPIGVKPEKGELAYTGKVALDSIRKELRSHLKKSEDRGYRFPAKPMEMKQLHLVAYVQDSSTGKILQAATFPVQKTPKAEKTPKPKTEDAETDN